MTVDQALPLEFSNNQLTCRGDWDLSTLPSIESLFHTIPWPKEGEISIDGGRITKLDSAGAWLIDQWQSRLKQAGLSIQLAQFSEEHAKLLAIIDHSLASTHDFQAPQKIHFIERVGRQSVSQVQEFANYLGFVGKLTYEMLRIIRHPKHFRVQSVAGVIYRNGYQAIPIIALLSFMIGVVITFQMGLQLQSYGANIFIVDLLGLSILREFGPLITAIMVAGRTGSAFTAQLGMMKINQEIDALDTLGVTPAELLLLPRIWGLVIALPLLTIWADIMGVIGGMVMANNMLGISWYDFLHRFPTVIPLRALLVGLGKTPVFALIISSVGCYQGIQVKENADSVGINTTRSVVLSIFFIIVADAIFSVIFSKLKL